MSFQSALLSLMAVMVVPAGAASFTNTSPMSTARSNHTATLLFDGKVLIAGGGNASIPGAFPIFLSSVELYDPVTGTWAQVGAMNTNRSLHTATLLANGKVLVTGGVNQFTILSSTELYDPVSGSWSATGAMTTNRALHKATLLPNGKVLIAGGTSGNFDALSSAELYDPATGMWAATGTMNVNRMSQTATLLPNGKVLSAGGNRNSATYLSSAELYDPATGIWAVTGAMITNRYAHTATVLPNGKVLAAGGNNRNLSLPLSSTELYDPTTGLWVATGTMIANRTYHTATLLPDGRVLVAGGYRDRSDFSTSPLSSAELYDPASGAWTGAATLNNSRGKHVAALLPSGKVLVAGGWHNLPISSVELYDPAIPNYNQITVKILSGGDLRLSYVGFVGANYALEHTLNLSAPNWQPLATNTAGDGGVLVFTNTPNTATNHFWRIRRVP